jgi:hypothetical protein
MIFYYKLKREFRLRRFWLRLWLTDLVRRYEQFICPHIWRPARVNGAPGKQCRFCEKVEQIKLEDFYAMFGEKGLAAIIKFDFPPASGKPGKTK